MIEKQMSNLKSDIRKAAPESRLIERNEQVDRIGREEKNTETTTQPRDALIQKQNKKQNKK